MMKKILIVVANPRKESLSFAIAEKYREIYAKKGNKIEILDLYREKNQQGFLKYENANKIPRTPEMKYFQEKITNSDELVFVFPFWWGGMPAILKNFFDWNLSAGYAFTYENSRPKGLLIGKTAKIFTTTGAPSFLNFILGGPRRLRKILKINILGFCGIKLKSFQTFAGVDSGKKDITKILEQIT